MTFNQINYFLTVAKYLNFSNAAAVLFVTQSTLSRSIASMEEELGIKLLERDYHNVKLTPPGELIYREMTGIMDEISDLFQRAQQIEENDTGNLVIGILDGQTVDSDVLASFRNISDIYPQFKVELKRTFYQELMHEIRKGLLDFALIIANKDQKVSGDIEIMKLKPVRYYLVANLNHPIWDKPVNLKTLDAETLIIPSDSNISTVSLKKYLSAAGIKPVLKTAEDTETNSLWLEAGMGVSIVNEAHIIYTSKAFRPLRTECMEELPEDYIALAWNRKNVSKMMELFLGFLKINNQDEI